MLLRLEVPTAGLVSPVQSDLLPLDILSMATHYMKQNDLLPSVEALLSTESGAVNLTGATVRFHMGLKDAAPVVNQPAVIVDAPAGRVRYDWQAGDTATVGTYQAEWEANFGGKLITFPNNSNFRVKITDDII